MSSFIVGQHVTAYAHTLWEKFLLPGDTVIDATCGNGHDTLFLAERVLERGRVIAWDLQERALRSAHQRIADNLGIEIAERVLWRQGCHSAIAEGMTKGSVKLVVYNLGYLPGGDKTVTTEVGSTLESLANALTLVCPGGAISITCYPGHEEGAREEEVLLSWAEGLSSSEWCVLHHRWVNRRQAPSVLLIQRAV